MPETPATTTSQKKYCSAPPTGIAIHLQFALLYPLCPRGLRNVKLSVFIPFVSRYASHLYRNAPPFVSQCASICIAIRLHLYRNTPPSCIAMFLWKYWLLGSTGCSQKESRSRSLMGNERDQICGDLFHIDPLDEQAQQT